MSHNVRTFNEEIYEPGEKVFYLRKKSNNWKGPAKVLRKDENFILVRHGSLFYRCDHADLMKVESDKKTEIDFSDKSKPVNMKRKKFKNSSTTRDEDDEDEDDEDDENVDGDGDDENYEDERDVRDVNEGGIGGKDVNELDARDFGRDEAGANAGDDNLGRCDLGERFIRLSLDVSYAAKVNRINDNSSRPKPKSAIKYHLANGAENEAKLLSYQPQRTGTSKNRVNVVDIGSEHPYSINWDEVI